MTIIRQNFWPWQQVCHGPSFVQKLHVLLDRELIPIETERVQAIGHVGLRSGMVNFNAKKSQVRFKRCQNGAHGSDIRKVKGESGW